MPLLTLNDIHVSFGPQIIFDKLDLHLYPGEKVGLVGPNGCGKTTLLKIILGIIEPEIGFVKKRRSVTFGYLPQEPLFDGSRTVLEELRLAAATITELQDKLHEASHDISRHQGDELEDAMNRYDKLTAAFDIAGGYEYQARIKEVAAGLGLDDKYHDAKTSQLSSGQLSRLGLAKVLLAQPNLLLLDEPTNHLDWEAALYLEKFLRNYKYAALIVSHDRFLLDRVVSKVVEIADRGVKVFSGNYTAYKKQKQQKEQEADHWLKHRLEFVARTRDFIDRNRNFKGMQKVARARQKMLDKVLEDDPTFLEKTRNQKKPVFNFKEVEQKSLRTDTILSCQNVSKSFDNVTLFEGLNFEMWTGERLGIIGPNGTGKTTLLKLILGKVEPTSGGVNLKKDVSIGYLDQTASDLNPQNSLLDEVSLVRPDLKAEKLRTRLGAFLFPGEDVFKKVADLSGGEKSRLALCKLIITEPEMLVLDEPTNHLDIAAIEALENALGEYGGTIIVVSHDRFFLDNVADRLIVIGADRLGRKTLGSWELITGSVSRYTQLLEARAEEKQQKTKSPQTNGERPQRPNKPASATPAELRPFNAWTAEQIETEITETEKTIEALQEQFGMENTYRDPSRVQILQADFAEKKQHLELLYRAYERKIL